LNAASAAEPAKAATAWTSYQPSYAEQEVGCGEIYGAKHLKFRLTCTTDDAQERAERRYETYSSGMHRFRGTFTITSMSGSRVSLKQTFHQDVGGYFMLAVDNTGRLYDVGSHQTLATGIKVGVPVRVQTVQRVGENLKVSINGKLVETIDSPAGNFYDKIGTYRTSTGHGRIAVTWKKLSFARK
jgi:hypothetical protein